MDRDTPSGTVVLVPASPRVPLRLVLAGTFLALLAAAATVVVLSGDDDSVDAGAGGTIELDPEGEPADLDTISYTTFDGEDVPLASLRGKPVMVNFFASYCPPCIREMPALEAAYQAVGDQVTFLGLAMQDRPEEAQALVERTGVTYEVAQDTDGSVITALGGIVLPTTVLLDAEGDVVASHAGELTEEQLLGMIADAFGIEP